jgi:predicted nucleotidyltransferase
MSAMRFEPSNLFSVLARHGVQFVVVGGFAGAMRGSPVITYDLDICYSREDVNLERLASALRELSAKVRGVEEEVPFQLDAESLRNGDSFTFLTDSGPFDILGTPAGTSGFDDLNAGATDEAMDGITLRVASVDDLIRMKRASGREKDRASLEWLRAIRDETEGRTPD